MKLPENIDLTDSDFQMSERLAEMFVEEINEYLANKYDNLNEGWGYEIKLNNIIWESVN